MIFAPRNRDRNATQGWYHPWETNFAPRPGNHLPLPAPDGINKPPHSLALLLGELLFISPFSIIYSTCIIIHSLLDNTKPGIDIHSPSCIVLADLAYCLEYLIRPLPSRACSPLLCRLSVPGAHRAVLNIGASSDASQNSAAWPIVQAQCNLDTTTR